MSHFRKCHNSFSFFLGFHLIFYSIHPLSDAFNFILYTRFYCLNWTFSKSYYCRFDDSIKFLLVSHFQFNQVVFFCGHIFIIWYKFLRLHLSCTLKSFNIILLYMKFFTVCASFGKIHGPLDKSVQHVFVNNHKISPSVNN